MKKNELMKTVSTSINKVNFKLQKHSPEILAVAGVIGITTSAIMACKATTKISEILEESKETIDIIKNSANNENLAESYTEEDVKKDLAITYVQTGARLVKLYAPSVTLGVLSLSGLLASNNILRKRNMALAAAYTTVDKGFKEYRSRVVERFGEQVDKELKYNVKAKKIDTIEIDPDTGKEKKVKKEVNVAGGTTGGAYSFVFDQNSFAWDATNDYNEMFLRGQQNYANDLLKARGHVFLNEVLDEIGLPRTKAGQIVGWVYNAKNPNGDNYVDFGMMEVYDEDNDTYKIMLDFNVDGNVLDLM